MRIGWGAGAHAAPTTEPARRPEGKRLLVVFRTLSRLQFRTWVAAVSLAMLAFALRSHGTDFGLPHLYYWDEPTLVNRAMRFGSGDLNPHFFVYPTLYMYVIFVLSGFHFVVGSALGEFEGITEFGVQYFVNPSEIYLSARLLTAVLGSATVVLVYFVGRNFFDELVGYIGAIFLAVSVLHASHSHIAIADVPQSLLIVAAYLPLHAIASTGRRRDYALCGLLIGLGMATKYVAALLLPSLLVAHLIWTLQSTEGQRIRSRLRSAFSVDIFVACLCALLGFLAGSPFVLLDFGTFWADLREQAAISGGEGGNSLRYFLGDVLPADLGWPLYLTAVAGMLLMAVRRRRMDLLFLLFPVLYLLFFARYDRVFARYMIQEDPFLALMAAYALVFAFTKLRAQWQQPAAVLLACVVLGLAAMPAYANIRWNLLMAEEVDTRTMAFEWANASIPDGTRVAIQPLFERTFYNAPLQTDRKLARLDADIPRGARFDAVRADVFRELESRPTFIEVEFVYDMQALKEKGTRFIFISDHNWSQSLAPNPTETSELSRHAGTNEEWRFARELEEQAVLVQEFNPKDVPGMSKTVLPIQPPQIRVYEIR